MEELPDTLAVETLRQDGEFVISRVKRRDSLPPWLLVSPASERPAPECLMQLEKAYALRDDLDSSWATRPLQQVFYKHRSTLILSDPGGSFLDGFLGGGPMEIMPFFADSAWYSQSSRPFPRAGSYPSGYKTG